VFTPRSRMFDRPPGARTSSFGRSITPMARSHSWHFMLVAMPTDFTLKTMNAVHRTALKLTGGRVGWSAAGMPVVELTTTGRKSGEPRTVMLTSPYQDGNTWIVVASRGGDDRPPAWLLNIEANPDIEVAFRGGAKERVHARIA